MMALEPGMLGAPNVRLEVKLAEGGMGSVWAAEHLTLKTRVAVKFVLAELGHDQDALSRFEREAQAVAAIKSPHIVQVLDYGKNELGHPYIVMELLEGEDLAARLNREKQIPLPVVAQIISQAAKAIGKAHQLGIVHRDLKPENLFLTDVEGDIFVKVLDFGIAKRAAEISKRMTATGSMLGTPIYMSPEQMTNAKAVGPGSDVWGLGIVAYHALTGEVPFDGETMAALAIAVDRGIFIPATSRLPTLPPEIDAWMAKALQKDPADRFASVREMAEALARIAGLAPRVQSMNDSGARLGETVIAPSLSASAPLETRTIRGMSTEARGPRTQRVWGLAALAIVLVAVAAAGLYLTRTSLDRGSSRGSAVISPAAESTSKRGTSPGPVVSLGPVPPSQAAPSASASSSGAPGSPDTADASARAVPSASASPAAGKPGHGSSSSHTGPVKPTEGIPTTF